MTDFEIEGSGLGSVLKLGLLSAYLEQGVQLQLLLAKKKLKPRSWDAKIIVAWGL